MRLLRWTDDGQVSLTRDLHDDERPPYAILSHTWAKDNSEEVTYTLVETAEGRKMPGYEKIRFCAEQARKDGINHCWVDTCCIDKTNLVELSEAITSMYRWYQEAVKCYVYLHDVSYQQQDDESDAYAIWGSQFQASKWFTRGWTLQELLAPKSVNFFSRERAFVGDKKTLAQQIHKITSIPVDALRDSSLTHFPVSERMRWAGMRQTKKPEDRVYSLLGIFDVSIPVIYGEGEKKAFHRLQGAIREQSGIAARSAHTHWMVPRTANPCFTGREGLLQELEDTVRDAIDCPWDRPQCRVVVSGVGGQGKSEVCLQLARRLRSVFWAVLWIDVSTTDMAKRSFVEVAQRLSISARDREDALYGIANLQYSWLLILDNADDPEVDYSDYFPDSRHGVILMTTRNNQCDQYCTERNVALEGLAVNEAQELLLKVVRKPLSEHSSYAEDARGVATLLQSHPLALIQAGAYISRGHCSLADYPHLYERQRQRLLTFRPTQARSRYGDVYATFEVSAEMLMAMNTPGSRDALQLLSQLVVCGPSQFPLSLFEAGWRGAQLVSANLDDNAEDEEVRLLTPWHVAHLPLICNAASEFWDMYRLVEAVNLLKAFSLLSINTHDNQTYLSFHALVHAWARDRQDQSQRQQAWLQMGCLTACAISQGDLTGDQRRQLQPHIEALVGWSVRDIFSTGPAVLVTRILVHCGWYLLHQRADAKLFTLLQDMFTALELDRLKPEQQWIGLYSLAGQNLEDLGRVKEAVAVLKQVVEIEKQTLVVNHLSRLASQHTLAMAYKANGQVREAVALLEEVVEIKKQILAADHPSRLASQHNLAIYLWDIGERERPLSIIAHVVDVRRRALEVHHPDRQASEWWLTYFEQQITNLTTE